MQTKQQSVAVAAAVLVACMALGCRDDAVKTRPNATDNATALHLQHGPEARREATSACGGHRIGTDISTHIYGVEGTVVSVQATSMMLQAVTVRVAKALDTALGWQPFETPGELAVIHFDECLQKFSNLRLATGSLVRIYYGGIDNLTGVPHPDDWGSNSSCIAVERGGVFVNADGRQVDSDDELIFMQPAPEPGEHPAPGDSPKN